MCIRVSRKIAAGALVGLGLSFLLNLFSVAIGLTALKTTEAGLTTLAIGGFIGMLIGTIATMYTSGWVAGYVARPLCTHRQMGALYGFASWALALILSVVLASQLTNFVAASYHTIANPKSVILKMTSNTDSNTNNASASPMTTEQTKGRNDTTQANVDTEKAAHNLGLTLLLTFVLFFVGALSSSIGGYCGLNPCLKSSDD